MSPTMPRHAFIAGSILALGLQLAFVPAASARATMDASLQALIKVEDAAVVASDPTLRTLKSITASEPDWTPVSDAYRAGERARAEARIATLERKIDRSKLSPEGRVRYDMFRDEQVHKIMLDRMMREGYTYGANIFDPIWELPQTLEKLHKIHGLRDAENYVARLRAIPPLLSEVEGLGRERMARGVTMVKADYANLARLSLTLSQGAPCAQGAAVGDHSLFANLEVKLKAVDAPAARKAAVLDDARRSLATQLCPAYAALSRTFSEMEGQGRDNGYWAMPGGKDAYRDALEFHMGARLDPQQLHEMGLREAARLKVLLDEAIVAAGFKGDFPAFEASILADDRFSVANTPEGWARYLKLAQDKDALVENRLGQLFGYVPRGRMTIRRTEQPLPNTGGGGTYYIAAAFDGSTPAYFSLDFNKDQPRFSLPALPMVVFHEGVPGHHMQQAVATERQSRLPLIKYDGYMSYLEGWGMYGEYLADELGGFEGDPIALVMWRQAQLSRAVRIVLDTGLNFMEWTPAKANEYQVRTLGKAGPVYGLLAIPGYRPGYYWGCMEFMRLRRKAAAALGDRFDVRAFHDIVLGEGVMSMGVLEEAVDNWVASVKAGPAETKR